MGPSEKAGRQARRWREKHRYTVPQAAQRLRTSQEVVREAERGMPPKRSINLLAYRDLAQIPLEAWFAPAPTYGDLMFNPRRYNDGPPEDA